MLEVNEAIAACLMLPFLSIGTVGLAPIVVPQFPEHSLFIST